MLNSVNIFAGADTFIIIAKGHNIFAHLSGGQAPAVLPCEGIAFTVVIAQGIADLVIGNALTSVCSQLVAPVGITIAVGIGAFRIGRSNVFSGQRIGILFRDIACFVVLIDIGLAEDGIVLPQQLALISGC